MENGTRSDEETCANSTSEGEELNVTGLQTTLELIVFICKVVLGVMHGLVLGRGIVVRGEFLLGARSGHDEDSEDELSIVVVSNVSDVREELKGMRQRSSDSFETKG